MVCFKSLIFVLGLVALARAASLPDTKNIHVEVVYDRPEDVPQPAKEIDKRNLQEDNQLPVDESSSESSALGSSLIENEQKQEQAVKTDKAEAEKRPPIDLLSCESHKLTIQSSNRNELKELPVQGQVIADNNINAIKNLDAKVQLSIEELRQSDKHIPGNPEQSAASDAAVIAEVQPSLQNEITAPQESTNELTRPSIALINKVREIINNGITNIRENVEHYAASNTDIKTVDEKVWKELNASMENLISNLKDQTGLKQGSEGSTSFFQSILSGFQSASNNFLQNIRPNNTASDEQQPGFGQNIINLFTGGFQQISGNLTSFGSQSSTESTVLGDSESSSAPSSPVSGFINQVQNFFSNSNPIQNLQGNQSDTGDSSAQQPGFFQNAASQIGQVITNFNVFQQNTSAPGSQNEEETSPSQPVQFFQNAANQIGQVFNNANPFNRPSTDKPAEGDEGSSSSSQPPLQVFQNAANQIGQVFNNANPFRPSSSKPEGESDEGTASSSQPPFQVFQNAANQIGQVINNVINRPTEAPSAESDAQTTQNQPFQFIQNVFGGLYQPSSKPPSGEADTSTQASNPILSGIQSAGTQVQQFFNQSNIQGLSPPQGIQNPLNNGSFAPPQGIQNPFGNGSFAPPEGIQNIFNNGSFAPPQGISNPFNNGSFNPPSIGNLR